MELRRGGPGRVVLHWRGVWVYSFLSHTVTGREVDAVVKALQARERARGERRAFASRCGYCGAPDGVQGPGACVYCGGV